MDRIILHIDMDAYFASVEQSCNPSLKGKPVIVCGEIAEGRKYARTIVIAASYESKRTGIKTGMPIPEARKLCPSVIIAQCNHDKYISTSLEIHKILLEYTDLVEVFSIDECFMDITRTLKFFNGTVMDLGRQIKSRIYERFGITSTVGIGPNKIIAKLLSKSNKPDGLMQILPEQAADFFSNLRIDKMQGIGIGNRLSGKLNSMGINTATRLGESPLDLLTSCFGITGYRLKQIGQGIDHSPVKKYLEIETVKSVGHSHTLQENTMDTDIIKSYILMLSEKTGARLRQHNFLGKTVSFVIRYSDFSTYMQQHGLKHCIKTGYEIYSNALTVFNRFLPLSKPVRLIGVAVSSLVPDNKQQYLFEIMSKWNTVTSVIDGINQKYGEFTIKPASVLAAEKLFFPDIDIKIKKVL